MKVEKMGFLLLICRNTSFSQWHLVSEQTIDGNRMGLVDWITFPSLQVDLKCRGDVGFQCQYLPPVF